MRPHLNQPPLSHTTVLEWNADNSPPPGANSRPGIVLVLAWLSALLWILPTSAHGQGVCDRTPQVRDKLVEVTGASGCDGVTSAHLAGVKRLDVSKSGITELQEHDFSGMNSLHWLRLNGNSLIELPQGIFSGLNSLEILHLHDNSLAELPENVFAGLSRLRNLTVYSNSLRALSEGIFSGLNSLQQLSLSNNSLTSLPEGAFSGLSNLQRLSLTNNTLKSLPEGVFSGLSNLRTLQLDFNSLTTLPEGIFSGLSSLEELTLWSNRLNSLPAGVFRALHSLKRLWLSDNSLTTLPAGIFDDILDTLGPETGVVGDLWVDPYLKATLAFTSTGQIGLQGNKLSVRVDLTPALPVAVRVPFSVGGTATADDYADLSPDPDSGLLFLAGETSKEIRFALPENDVGLGKTIALTLGELSRIRLRRSDGSPPDAPFLKAETLLNRPEDRTVHTVAISSLNQPAGLCDRTPQIKDRLLEITGISTCGQVTLRHLAEVTGLDLSGSGITSLQADDFSGLVALQNLLLNDNALGTLPSGVFSGLRSLRVLWLQGNGLYSLPRGVLDDVVHRLEDLRVDPRLKARLAFESSAQETVTGATVRVRVWLSRALPVAVRVPYGVGGTAAKTDYVGLSPSPEVGLLFPAGETGGEIVFTPLENSEGLGKTVVLTLGDISEIGLRRSDGSGEDARRLDARALVDRPDGGAIHTVTIAYSNQPADVCDRTPQVRDALVVTIGRACTDMTTARLAEVRFLLLNHSGITTLQAQDFSGLIGLEYLFLNDNSLGTLPNGVFSGLSSLEELWLQNNSLSTLPAGVFEELNSLQTMYLFDNSLSALPSEVFRGLGNLRKLQLQRNSLSELPKGVFEGLSKLEELLLADNSLNQLQDGVFSGLDNLRSLWLTFNPLSELPKGVFEGLSKLEELLLAYTSLEDVSKSVFKGLNNLRVLELFGNSLYDLPEGILDDVLDTLGGDYTVSFGRFILGDNPNPIMIPFRGRLAVDSQLKATLWFDSTATKAPEGATVSVPVTLSKALPVAVRVPYSVGFGGASCGYTNLSPAPDSGILFPAGETQREISLTLLKDAAAQGERSLVLALGKASEIRLRQSGGKGPDAPDLNGDSLLFRSDHRAVHTVTVSDVDPVEQDPFCFSLWEGSPCSAVAILPHVLMGPLGEHLAGTEVAVTHRDPGPAECEAALLFHRGTSPASAVSFSGRFPDGNLFLTTLPKGGAELLTLTAPDAQELTSGALYVFARSPCHAGSLQVQARHLLESPSDGETEELFSVAGQSEKDWLGDGDCRRLTALLGNGREVGLASVTAQPGQTAPPGTRLRFAEFDLKGNFVGGLGSLEISGQHQATSPWTLDRPAIIQMCLDVPGASNFQLAIAAMGTAAGGAKVQFSTVSIPDDTGPDGGGPSP